MSLTGFLSYSRVNWQQSPSKSTPWNATNLNIMDAGIKNNNDMISNIRDEITQLNSNIDVKNSFCKNIASINGTLEGYGYNYCYYNYYFNDFNNIFFFLFIHCIFPLLSFPNNYYICIFLVYIYLSILSIRWIFSKKKLPINWKFW